MFVDVECVGEGCCGGWTIVDGVIWLWDCLRVKSSLLLLLVVVVVVLLMTPSLIDWFSLLLLLSLLLKLLVVSFDGGNGGIPWRCDDCDCDSGDGNCGITSKIELVTLVGVIEAKLDVSNCGDAGNVNVPGVDVDVAELKFCCCC